MSGHLQHSATTGHLLHNTAGHLVYCLEDCHDCYPSIPDTLYATFSGLSGDFAAFNGKHTINYQSPDWASGCTWCSRDDASGSNDWVALVMRVGVGHWQLIVHVVDNCSKVWISTPVTCDPTGSYSENSCTDTSCADGASCENSAGATAAVSYS